MRLQIKKVIAVCVTIAQIIVFAGCHTTKTQVTPVGPTYPTETVSRTATSAECFDSIAALYKDYDCFIASFKISLNAPQRISFSGRAYVERNKSVYLSLRKFGMEVARLYLTNDSVVAVDRFNKRYVAESLSEALARCPVTIGNIQNLLTGHVFVIGGGPLKSEDFVFDNQPENSQWTAIPKDLPAGFESGYLFSSTDNSLLALAVKGGSTTFLTRYSDFYPTPGGPAATNVGVKVAGMKFPLDLSIEWTWTGAVWNKPADMKQFVYPDREYKRIAAADLLKML